MRWPEVTLRLALIAALIAAVGYDITAWITAPLGLLAIAATGELAVRPYAANAADRLLLGCGATVTTLILTGLALNLTPWGLTKTTWSAAWLTLSIGVLLWRRGFSTQVRRPAAGVKSLGVWMVLASIMLVAAVVLALAGVRRWDRQPVLAFSVVSRSTSAIVVEIDATSISGSYRITAAPDAQGASDYSSALLDIEAGGAGERVRERVPVDIPGTWTIDLRSGSDGTVVRMLKVNAA